MRSIPLVTGWILACTGLNGCAWVTKDELAAREDQDKDGHIALQFGGDDCDDAADAVYPDAVETCDGKDDDCDGQIDDVRAGAGTTWYTDGDGDGAGDPNAVVAACEQPEGAADNASDCDDQDALISPSAAEICDGIDNDCDGLIDDEDASVTDAPTWYQDADGDGYGDAAVQIPRCEAPRSFVDNADDCDDADSGVYPGAPEHCDGHDESCDGVVDDSAVDVTTWYTDADGDGWGNLSSTVTACDAPAGMVAQGGDCDDTDASTYPYAAETCTEKDMNCDGKPGATDEDGDGVRGCDGDCEDGDPTVYPGAPEVCDGVDDDCNGLADDDDPDLVTAGLDRYYVDSDGDGYGDASDAGVYACSLPAGRVASDDDCDDTDSGIHPGAYEVCSTASDDDCDGATDDCTLTLGSVGLSFAGETEGDLAGARLVSADLDGDGRGDLAVGAPGRQSAKGSVYVVLDPTAASASLGDAVEWKGSSASDAAGSALVPAGDVDYDGLDDLGVGAPGGERAFVLSGPASAGGGLTGADAVLSGPGSSSDFGAALWFGDLDHDGHPDVAVGAPLQDQPGVLPLTTVTDAGQVDVFFGPLSGDLSADAADATFIDSSDGSGQVGRALVGADADGDGVPELIVAGFHNNGFGTLTPEIYVLETSTAGAFTLSDVSRTIAGASGRKSGDALCAAGDVDGDGTADLIVGDSAEGQAFLLLGPLSTAPTTLSGADAVLTGSGDFGSSVALLQDLDGDGVDELAVGGDNAVALWMGGADLTGSISISAADLLVSGARSADQAGAAVAAGDLDGDGHADLAIGGPGTDSEIGAVWALLGPF